jgi:hypothetical protein
MQPDLARVKGMGSSTPPALCVMATCQRALGYHYRPLSRFAVSCSRGFCASLARLKRVVGDTSLSFFDSLCSIAYPIHNHILLSQHGLY